MPSGRAADSISILEKAQYGPGLGRRSLGLIALGFCLGLGRDRSVALEPQSLLRKDCTLNLVDRHEFRPGGPDRLAAC